MKHYIYVFKTMDVAGKQLPDIRILDRRASSAWVKAAELAAKRQPPLFHLKLEEMIEVKKDIHQQLLKLELS